MITPGKSLTNVQVQSELNDICPGIKPDIDDNLYFLPEIEWLDEFGLWCAAHCPRWEPERGDCDDQQDWAVEKAYESILKCPEAKGMGKAFGRIKLTVLPWFNFLGLPEREDFATHRCNVVRCRDRPWMVFQVTNGLYEPLGAAVDAGNIVVLSIGL